MERANIMAAFLDHLTDFEQVSLNRLENRNYFIPYHSREAALSEQGRQKSNALTLLNGEWQFKYFASLLDLPDNFSDYGAVPFSETIKVPSTWQTEGYDTPQYTNEKFPLPFDPPFVPDENPCGLYQRDFVIAKKDDQRYFINLEGVDSCFYLWINQKLVGFDALSHGNSEFDITEYLENGQNIICMLVVKWNLGSYLENQDKFRFSGIFRDIYLLERPVKHIERFQIKTQVNTKIQEGTIELTNIGDQDIDYQLFDPQKRAMTTGKLRGGLKLTIDNCQFWNAESPALYTLLLVYQGEFIPVKIGIREWCLEEGNLLLNDQKVKLYGVNHHDFNPLNGSAVTMADQLSDLLLMKKHHFNAIRTSHYPKSPEFYELCDRLGFYVISEADIESHGVIFLFGMQKTMDFCEKIANNPQFKTRILDRVERMVDTNRNFTSIFSWSMGNESGFGTNFVDALALVKAKDDTRFAHYESVIFNGRKEAHYEYSMQQVDLYSRMYWSKEETVKFLTENPKVPLILCEYSHSMGNGPGDLKMYDELIQKYDNFIGGFVWEWCDQALMMPNHNTKKAVGYGGDFNDFPNASNFCIDGLVSPERQPHVGLKEYQAIHLPIGLVSVNKEQVCLKNRQAFLQAAELYQGIYRYSYDGQPDKWQNLTLTDFEPGTLKNFEITLPKATQNTTLVTLEWSLKSKIDGSIEVGIQQIILKDSARVNQINHANQNGVLKYRQISQRLIEIKGANFTYIYNQYQAQWASLEFNEEEWLEKPAEWHVWRAPTDNDAGGLKSQWLAGGYNRTIIKHDNTEIVENGHGLIVKTHFGLTAKSLQRIMNIEVTWHIENDGNIKANLEAIKDPLFPILPRFGMELPIKGVNNTFEYLGYGPNESYRDKHQASYLNVFNSTAVQNEESYLVPQENGSHFGTRWVHIQGQLSQLRVQALADFSFNYAPHSANELTGAQHSYELETQNINFLSVDYAQNGIGSNSCGPELQPEYCFSEAQFDWQFEIAFLESIEK